MTLIPTFAPEFMPEITRSGRWPSPKRSGQIRRMPSFTQSAGRPSTAKPRMWGAGEHSSTISGVWKVMPWLVALCPSLGAIVTTSPRSRIAACRAAMPGAWMPSSLVSMIRMGRAV